MEEVLLLESPPIQMESIWGDGRLAKKYHYAVAQGVDIDRTPIGGYFCEDSIIRSGEYAGKTLKELYDTAPEYFGTKEERRWEILPISMACLYACEDLSVQVHPREDWANEHLHAHGKSECWYFPEVDEPTTVVLGHNAKTMDELKDYIERGDWEHLLRRRPVETGSFYAIKAGTVHAVQKGCMFIEICNPSPVTYRFYDYGRLDRDGKPRKLDVDLALENILVPDALIEYERKERTNGQLKETFLADNPDYAAWLYEAHGQGTLNLLKPYAGAYVVHGSGKVNGIPVQEGEIFFLSKAAKTINVEGDITILCCHG